MEGSARHQDGFGQESGLYPELGVDEPTEITRKLALEDVAHDVDVVLDDIGAETRNRSWRALKKGGILVSIVAPPSEEEATKHGVRAAPHLRAGRHIGSGRNCETHRLRINSSQSSTLCCRCPKLARLTSSMKVATLAAKIVLKVA
jgi:hypothetical protein